MKIDKSLMKDEKGRYLTQGLFFELTQKPESAIFTLDGQDKGCENNRAVRPLLSLKRLYLEAEDPHEYDFATTYLYDWTHWQKLLANKVIRRHIDMWRDELEIKIRSAGFQKILDKMEEGDIQATKYVADKGWDKRAGRPSKYERDRADKINEKVGDEFEADLIRLEHFK
jgi:hypothetical protein